MCVGMEKPGRQMPYTLEPEKCAGRLDFSNNLAGVLVSPGCQARLPGPSTNLTARPLLYGRSLTS